MSNLESDRLQSLFANLRPGKSDSPSADIRPLNEDKYTQNHNASHVAAQPQRFFTFEPTTSQPQPHVPMMSANNRSASASKPHSGDSNADRTASLLNLLRFNQPASNTDGSAAQQEHKVQEHEVVPSSPASTAAHGQRGQATQNPAGHDISTSDLVASLIGKSSSSTPRLNTTAPPVQNLSEHSRPASVASPSQNSQNFLLKLLNQTKPLQNVSPSIAQSAGQVPSPKEQDHEAVPDDLAQELANVSLEKAPSGSSDSGAQRSSGRTDSPIRVFGDEQSAQPTPFEPQQVPKKSSLFTYVNPFEQLAASSPRNRTPQADKSRSASTTPALEVPKPSKTASHDSNRDGPKRKTKETLPRSEQPTSRRKLTPSGDEIMASIESSSPALLPDGRSQVEALLGIGVPTRSAETVAEALNEVGDKVNKQMEAALAKAEERNVQEGVKRREKSQDTGATFIDLEKKVQNTAIEVKKELDKAENQGLLEEALSEPVAEVIKDIIDDAAQGTLADSWESADGDDSPTKDGNERVVRVYNFPMRPFVTISIKSEEKSAVAFRDDAIMDIARLKKEFDQIDRTLVTATTNVIVYAMSKYGGLRIIRQDDGMDKQVFRSAQDSIFNVTISTGASGGRSYNTQAAIATGVSGSVYWILLSQDGQDLFENENMEKQGLVFPPTPAHDDNSSGGQLKTRAKKSSRHPEFFAIGRGKSIHIVWPFVAGNSNFGVEGKARVVDTEKLFKERTLKITTGKAGKDFTFSEDDTLIVSLDKAGKMKLWDIRDLVDEANATADKIAPIDVKTPLLTFNTVAPAEKSWPTSVQFVDKVRPYAKGTALRYLVVGMKQNHTLQLWDLGLGKAVQELNFPHAKESDGICSVAYHPASGIIVVGHPTRNSIYFVHLSAPKYNLPAMSQSKFVELLAQKDSTLPKPDATAIMSGIREISFASKGQLRSVDLLPVANGSGSGPDRNDDQVLFELYAMHSRGVTCLSIKRADLGWSKDNRVLHPVDAEEKGVVSVNDLREQNIGPFSEPSSVNGDQTSPPELSATPANKQGQRDITRKSTLETPKPINHRIQSTGNASVLSDAASAVNVTPVVALNGFHDKQAKPVEKLEKKKKKRGAAPESVTRSDDASTVLTQPTSSTYATAAQRALSPVTLPPSPSNKTPSQTVLSKARSITAPSSHLSSMENQTKASIPHGESISLGISGEFLDKELKKIEKGVLAEFNKVIGHELNSLYRRFDEDKRVQDAAGAAKQDAILRLVSSTLSDNVEKSLARIITSNIQQVVLPSIADVTSSTLDRKLQEVVSHHVHQSIPRELRAALPEAISRAMQNPEVLRVISDLVANKVAAHVESEFSSVLHSTISPAFKSLAVGAAQRMTGEVERRVSKQIHEADAQRYNDSLKIDQLTNLVRGLSETIHTMATAQSEFQHEFLKLQRQVAQGRQDSTSNAASSHHPQVSAEPSDHRSPPPAVQKSPEEEELEAIISLMNEGRYEEGTIRVSRAVIFQPS